MVCGVPYWGQVSWNCALNLYVCVGVCVGVGVCVWVWVWVCVCVCGWVGGCAHHWACEVCASHFMLFVLASRLSLVLQQFSYCVTHLYSTYTHTNQTHPTHTHTHHTHSHILTHPHTSHAGLPICVSHLWGEPRLDAAGHPSHSPGPAEPKPSLQVAGNAVCG